MRLDKCALLCALLVFSVIVDPISAKRSGFGGRSGGHSYPRSGGLSGGGHGYPSGGHSSGGSHGYPSSGGLSGGSHGYPASGGLSGTGRGTGSHAYPPAGNSHGYPPSGGLSGSGSNTHHSNSHGYAAGSSLSGKPPVTNVHHHYHYSPPQSISYPASRGGPVHNYPVYQGQPPTYVYKYKDSGSKYGTLLAGLALLNLGALGATAYAASRTHSTSNYKPQPGEICKFGLKKDNGDYEETNIECQLITSFIFQEQQANPQNGAKNTTVTTTTVTNTTIVNGTNGAPETSVNQTAPVDNPLYEMLPNGTLVPVNRTETNNTVITGAPVDNNSSMSSSVVVTTTTTNTTVVDALDVKGKEVEVTPGMQCFVIRQTPSSRMKKTVPCGLLQSYATQSLKRNSAGRNIPALTILVAVVAAFVMY